MNGAPNDLSRQAERLTRLYILALSVVACLSIVGQLLVQWSLDRQLSDSTVINLAGRQRMLSQRLSKAALALQRPSSLENLVADRQEMAEVLAQWRRTDAGLRRGDEILGLPGRNSTAVGAMLTEIEPHFRAMETATESLLAGNGDANAALNQLLAHEPLFLAAMDAIVQQYEQESRARVAWLKGVERSLLLLTLLVLACEGALVFRPAIRRLRLAARAMEESRRQLEIARQQADSANEAKSRFLATISHELRNPLQAILGSVELATSVANDTPRQEHLETISTAARALLVLLNDLLDLARIEAGKLEIVSMPLDPIRLTERTLALVKPQALSQGLQLNVSFPDVKLTGLCGDEIRVQQVLLNFLTNAIKFTPTGIIQVRLSLIVLEPESARLRWEVTDTGIGIAGDQRINIFEPFTQASQPDLRTGGAGLGLAICKRLVGLMQGEIGVESKLGAGSTFWFELPLTRSTRENLAGVVQQLNSRPALPLRVLLVDDDPVNRRLLIQLTESLGHHVVPAENGNEALAKFREAQFDVAILDWQLPDMNGGKLAAALRSVESELRRSHVALIALSAAVEHAPGQSREDAPFDRWLTKPIGIAELAQSLGSVPAPQQRGADCAARWEKVLARLGGRRELLAQLARTWCADLPETWERLQTAVNQNCAGEVARLAHLLAGQAANFDAHDLSTLANSVEECTLANTLDASLVARLKGQCWKLEAELNSWIAEAMPLQTRKECIASPNPLDCRDHSTRLMA